MRNAVREEVRNTARNFGEILLTMFEKYRKRGKGPFLSTGAAAGIAYSSSLMLAKLYVFANVTLVNAFWDVVTLCDMMDVVFINILSSMHYII